MIIVEGILVLAEPLLLEFVQSSMREADVIIPRGGRNRVAIEMVIAGIESLLTRTAAEY